MGRPSLKKIHDTYVFDGEKSIPIENLPTSDWRKGHGDLNGWQPETSVIMKSDYVNEKCNNEKYVYIDAGANVYKSSIGNWFLKHYKCSEKFKIIAFEPEKKYAYTYLPHPEIDLIQKAVWTKNDTLHWSFKYITQNKHYNDIHNKVSTIDFVDYLKRNFKKEDYVVIKMDIEGSEYAVVPDIITRNATFLIDELFLEAHTNINSCCIGRKDRTFEHAKALVNMLRTYGVYAHMWG